MSIVPVLVFVCFDFSFSFCSVSVSFLTSDSVLVSDFDSVSFLTSSRFFQLNHSFPKPWCPQMWLGCAVVDVDGH